jgi:hypothetical protein
LNCTTITSYQDLQNISQASHIKQEEWEYDLFQSANSLHKMLIEKLNPPTEAITMRITNEELIWDPIMLKKPIGEANQSLFCRLDFLLRLNFLNLLDRQLRKFSNIFH